MKRFMIPVLMTLCFMPALLGATDIFSLLNQGETAYKQARYDSALAAYSTILKTAKKDGKVLYNIGNCHYRLNQYGLSKAYYLRALKSQPRDQDIHHNLNILNSQLVDQQSSTKTIARILSLIDLLSFNEWLMITLTVSSITMTGILLGLFVLRHEIMRHLMGVLIIICLIQSILFITKASREFFDHRVVITSKKVAVKNGPSPSMSTVFFMHEGALAIQTATSENWSEIRLENGFVGWIENKYFTPINMHKTPDFR